MTKTIFIPKQPTSKPKIVPLFSKEKEILSKIDSHNTKSDQFAKWMYEKVKNGATVTIQECGEFLCGLLGESQITEYRVRGCVSKSKEYLEWQLNCLLVPVPGIGWRMGVGIEKGEYAAKLCHMASQWVHRALRAQSTLSEKEIDTSYREKLLEYGRKFRSVDDARKGFSQAFLEHRAVKRTREKLEQQNQKFIT